MPTGPSSRPSLRPSTFRPPTLEPHGDSGAGAGCCGPVGLESLTAPVEIGVLERGYAGDSSFWSLPFGPLLFQNEASDARDHCANERTFLSNLKLSVYMAVVSTSIMISFHLRKEASPLELKVALPLGSVFWVLALFVLIMGIGNYINTINKYSRKAAIVQTGWKTQAVVGFVALSIMGTCIMLLIIQGENSKASI